MKRLLMFFVSLVLLISGLLPVLASQAYADTPVNLIANPSAETLDGSGDPVNWTPNTWGTSDTTLSTTNIAHSGNVALNITTTSRTSGDAKWMPDAVTVTGGQTYTYIDYSESSVATQLDAAYTDASGNVSYDYLATVQPSTNWQENTVDLTVPANETAVAVLHLLPTAGTLTTDDFNLSVQTPIQLPQPTGSNLIANPSMEVSNATDTAPAGWQTDNWGTNTASFTYATNNGHTGNASAKVQITKYTSGDAKWYFTPVAVQPNMQYTFSDYYESTIATSLVVRFDDGSGNYTYVEPTDPASASAWTQATTTFTTPSTAKYVTVLHLIAGVGTLQTDDASLVAAATSLPQVSITGPTSDATVSGSAVTLSAAASDSTGIASVQFQVDGANVGQAVTNSPYQYVWDSSTVGNGTHSITAVATSTDGQSATSTSVGVQVSNAAQTNGNVVPNPTLNIVNPSDSTEPDSWWPVTWGTNTTSFSYLKTGDNDTNSLKVQTTAYTSGASEWMFASQQATPDTQYKFSDYYKSNIPSEIEIEFNMSDGTQLYQQLGLPQKSTSWTQFTTVFNAPIGTESFSVYQFIQEVGYVTTDDYSITPYTPIGFNEPLVTLTFDDGYASTFENGLPLLQKYGFTSTQFIITDEINGSDFMTPQNLQTMYQDGNEIASHTVTHDDMTQETSSQLKTELSQSQQQLTAWLGIPITDIAYPYGLYNSAALTATAKYYTAARGVEDGLNSKDVFNPYDLKVENVFTTTTTAQVADWVKQAQTTNTWLILVYHSVSPTPTDENNVTPTQLDSQLAVIKASGVKVENMNTAFSEVTSQL